MIYDYVDTVEHESETYLPAEAVSLNGEYLEDLIEGYRTLYVKGRESLESELDTYGVGTADGERIKGSRYPARTLTVGFQLLAKSNEDFRIAFNQLNNILSIDEADFIFNDETDKYFTGTPIMDADIEAGRNNVTGEWKIFCGFPFKRSVELITLSTDDEQGVVVEGNKATFSFEYNGRRVTATDNGNGRLDAVSNALRSYTGRKFNINAYTEHALEVGSASKAVSYVEIVDGSGVHFWGTGIDNDIITSSVKALVSAVNNSLTHEKM